ncbi:MAG: DNA repair protein RadC [Firmicutes bacterium]|jgi:DNA repair protein RadC|nr:DNA repair protein RadC [Bacillota bacterium]
MVVQEKLVVKVKELPASERPREKLWQLGPRALALRDLLAIILRVGSRRDSALTLADRLLAKYPGLVDLAAASVEDLCQIEGIGPAKAAQLKAACELARRLARASCGERPAIRGPSDAARLVMEEMRHLDREHFRVLLLNTKRRVIAIRDVSVGGLDSSLVHPRELFKECIRRSSAAVILVHNHPSGDPQPSQDDIRVTRRLCEAGKLLGIEVLDHIIIGDNKFVSLKEMGFLES